MAAIHADRYVDLAHHHGLPVAHVARVALNQIRADVTAGSEACGIIEDAAVAAVGGIEGHVAGPLCLRIDFVVNRQISVAIDADTEGKAIVAREKRFLKFWQCAVGPVEHAVAMLDRLRAFDLDVVLVKNIVDADIAARDSALENFCHRIAGFHRASDQFGVFVVNAPDLVLNALIQHGICVDELSAGTG